MRRLLPAGALAALVLAFPLVAAADHATREHTKNLHALGHSPHPASFFGATAAERNVSSDIAFWGNLIFHGNYDGFRIIKASPGNPKEIVWQRCNGDQGDIVVWGNIVVRAWNSPAPEGRLCDGRPVPAGFEGVHVFDVSDLTDPQLVAAVELPCGSHTLTLAGISSDRLIVYSNNSSSAGCVDGTRANDDPVGDFMDILAVPLDNPAGATLLRREPLAGPTNPNVRTGCHDAGVIRGDVNLAVCASADTTNVFSIGSPRGGSLEDPLFLYTITEPGVDGLVGRWHSAALTWDGEVIILGWEPGGGSAPFCTANGTPVPVGMATVVQADVHKSMFFYDADTGAKLGQWVLPRAQSLAENCTVHNYNIVPLRSGRYVAVSGNYQAGTWVTDFTNPASPVTVAWSDPPPLGQVTPPPTPANPNPVPVNELGGAWSTYWYNNFVYESEITKGLNVFRLSGRTTAGAMRLDHLNPQTQDFSLR